MRLSPRSASSAATTRSVEAAIVIRYLVDNDIAFANAMASSALNARPAVLSQNELAQSRCFRRRVPLRAVLARAQQDAGRAGHRDGRSRTTAGGRR